MNHVPKVSCICITRNRRMFVRQAIQYYLEAARLYFYMVGGESELVVVDGSDEPQAYHTSFLHSKYPIIYTYRPEHVLKAGLSHNVACDQASGDIIIHWDDDDWQHSERIYRQVQSLMTHPEDCFSYTSQFYHYHIERRKACRSKSWGGEGSTGATFAYWKNTWRRTPFREIPICEDVPFQADLGARGCPMIDGKDPQWLVYMRHNQNGSSLTQYQFTEEDTLAARRTMGLTDCDFYDGIGELLPVANWNHPNAPGSKIHARNPLEQLWLRHHR